MFRLILDCNKYFVSKVFSVSFDTLSLIELNWEVGVWSEIFWGESIEDFIGYFLVFYNSRIRLIGYSAVYVRKILSGWFKFNFILFSFYKVGF